MMKRLLALFLALVLVVGVLPTPAYADEIESTEETEVYLDVSALGTALDNGFELLFGDYTEETLDALAAALEEAEAVYFDGNAAQADVDAALALVLAAIDALEPLPEETEPEETTAPQETEETEPSDDVDKTGLLSLIAAVEALWEADYTEETWADVQIVLLAAQILTEDEEASQTEIDGMVEALSDAAAALEKNSSVDKTALNEKITEAESLVEEAYTAESWAAMQTALTEAKAAAENPAADKETVDAALAALTKAADALEPVIALYAEEDIVHTDDNVVVSVEGQTLSHGFYIEPTIVSFDEFIAYWAQRGVTVNPEDITAGGMIDYVLYTNGYTRDHGAQASVSGPGYLSGIDGIREGKGEAEVPDCLADDGITVKQIDGDDLYEKTFTAGAGWMFTEHNWLSNQAMAGHKLYEYGERYSLNGENYYVVRLQYTIAGLGADLGFEDFGTSYGYSAADKSELYILYANLEEAGALDNNPEGREAALAVMNKLDATQEEVDNAYAALLSPGQAEKPTFITNLPTEIKNYPQVDAEAEPLTVEAEALGSLSYQWYMSTDRYNWTAIPGETENTYTPSTAEKGTTYYKCTVTNSNAGQIANSADSAIATVAIGSLPQKPWWDWNGGDLNATAKYSLHATDPKPLQVKATPAYGDSGSTLSYQWYEGKVGVSSIDEMTPIAGATEKSYLPDVHTEYVRVYACRVFSNKDGNRNFIDSTLCTVTVAYDIVEISTEEQLRNIQNDGNYKLTDDITLTEPWTPKDGFCGTLDGNGHTIYGLDSVCTTSYGGGLFGYTMGGAVIKNLGIEGRATTNGVGMNAGAAAILGNAYGATTISNCYANVEVIGNASYGYDGGLVAKADNCVIEKCYFTGTVTTISKDPVGGIAGSAGSGIIRSCYATSGAAIGTGSGENVYGLDEIPADMEEFAALLGEGFKPDYGNVNGGYPVLAWQKSEAPVDKEALNAKIAEAETLSEETYTAESWAAMQTALTEAKAVADNVDAAQDAVDQALNALTEALEALEEVPVDKTQRIQTILDAISENFGGTGDDWEAVGMAAYGMADKIDVALLKSNAEKYIFAYDKNATNYERLAISATAAGLSANRFPRADGSSTDLISEIATMDELGTTNGYIFALNAYDSGNYTLPEGVKWTRDAVIEELMNRQCNDGGWNLGGNVTGSSDVDLTAMAVTALSLYRDRGEVEAAIDKALDCLSAKQSDKGGYKSWGQENSNSASMVIIALASLDLDADSDERFVKNGKSVLDSLLTFETEDHRFGYTKPVYDYNGPMATEQGFRALVAYTNWQEAGEAYYLYDFAVESVDVTALGEAIAVAEALKPEDYTTESFAKVIEALAEAKKVLDDENAAQQDVDAAAAALRDAIDALVPASDINTTDLDAAIKAAEDLKSEDYTAESFEKLTEALEEARKVKADPAATQAQADAAAKALNDAMAALTVRFTFRLVGDAKHGQLTPHDTYVTWIPTMEMELPVGKTLFDAFKLALEENGMEFRETQPGYIGKVRAPAVLGGYWLGEFDNGSSSGWMYTRNGEHEGMGVRACPVEQGDAFVWHYVDDFTDDDGSWKDVPDTAPEAPVDPVDHTLREAYETTAQLLQKQTPGVGSVGGEWAVLGLARSEFGVPNNSYVANYYSKVIQYVKENINNKEQLNASKSTDNARLVLALTAIGKNPENVGGHDLLKGLSDLEYLKKQGLNGPIWALIAYDTNNYDIPGTLTREKLVDYILSQQLPIGGWARTATGTTPNVDVTAMAMYALAPYQDDARVLSALNKAIEYLSSIQSENGGFDYGDQGQTAETCSQVITALSSLGIDAAGDPRFVKGENSLIDAFLTFYRPEGGFYHNEDHTGVEQMATEQAFYAMAAYFRNQENQNRLFDMSDVETEDPGKPVDKSALADAVAQAKALTESDYTSASWKALKTALSYAEYVLAKDSATQDQVNSAAAMLHAAIDDLEKPDKNVDKSELADLIEEAESLKEEDYTPESWKKLQGTLTAAKGVYNSAKVTEAQVADAVKKLADAMDALVDADEGVDKSALQKAVDKAETLVKSKYTSASWKPFASALTSAKGVLANGKATQAQVDSALDKLTKATQGLKRASTLGGNPKTGDTMPLAELAVVMSVSLMGLAAAAAYVSRKRRKN